MHDHKFILEQCRATVGLLQSYYSHSKKAQQQNNKIYKNESSKQRLQITLKNKFDLLVITVQLFTRA